LLWVAFIHANILLNLLGTGNDSYWQEASWGTLSDAVLHENGTLPVEATHGLHALPGWLREWGIEGRRAAT